MIIARSHVVDPRSSGAFHVVSRCVRRAWLCGRDPVTGRDFSHRKHQIEERIVALAAQFAIGVYAYAVMSNHAHLVVRTAPETDRYMERPRRPSPLVFRIAPEE